MSGRGLGRSARGPPLASIESLLSFEAKSTPRSEFGHIVNTGMSRWRMREPLPLYTPPIFNFNTSWSYFTLFMIFTFI